MRLALKKILKVICLAKSHSRLFTSVLWMLLKTPHSRPLFKVFSTIQGKTMARQFSNLALRLYNVYNHAHVPGPHMWPSPGPGQDSKCSKTVEVGCSC